MSSPLICCCYWKSNPQPGLLFPVRELGFALISQRLRRSGMAMVELKMVTAVSEVRSGVEHIARKPRITPRHMVQGWVDDV
jgi:hypothetical protein